MRAVLLLLGLAACGKHMPSDRDYCDLRQTSYERAYPEETTAKTDHDKLVEMCVHGVAEEHGRLVRDGHDEFERRLACSGHLGDEPALKVWEDMKDCESRTLF